MVIKAIIFDCFGVLVGGGFDRTYRHAGGDPNKDRDFIEDILEKTSLGQISSEEFRQSIADRLGTPLETYMQAVKEAEQPDYELLSYAKELRKKYKTAVLSNANVGVLQRKIPTDWLNDCFDELVVSAEVGLIKPQEEIYKLMAERLDVELSECVFTDDQPSYCSAAKALGMKAIVYKDFDSFKTQVEKLLTNTDN